MTTCKRLDEQFNFKHFDASLFDLIEDEVMRDKCINTTLVSLATVVNTDGDEMFEFEFNASSIALIEKFLREKHMHRVLRWGEGAERLHFKRVINTQGLHSSSAKHIMEYGGFICSIGWLYAYCLGREVGGKFVLNNGEYGIRWDGDELCFPIQKVFKFLRYGEEDSLVAFLRIVKSRKATQAVVDSLSFSLKEIYSEQGYVLPAGYRRQVWYRENGMVNEVAFVDANGEFICSMQHAENANEIKISTKTGEEL